MDSIWQYYSQLDASSIILLTVTLVVFAIPLLIVFPPVPVDLNDLLGQTHTKLGLPPSRSNLHGKSSATAHTAQAGRSPKIQSLHVFPVKSCAGIEVTRSKLLPAGLEFDRLFAFAQQRSPKGEAPGDAWELLTRQNAAALANLKVDLWIPDKAKKSRQLGKVEESFVVLRFPWVDGGLKGVFQRIVTKLSRGILAAPEKEVLLQVEFPSDGEISARRYEYAEVNVGNETVRALNISKDIPKELERYLGLKHPLALFRIDPAGQEVGLQDVNSLKLLNLSSLRDLVSKTKNSVEAKTLDTRFTRANITVSGAKELDEKSWASIGLRISSGDRHECLLRAVPQRETMSVESRLAELEKRLRYQHKAKGDAQTPESFVEVGMEIEVVERGTSH